MILRLTLLCRFVHAVNGEQALAMLEHERPDAMRGDIDARNGRAYAVPAKSQPRRRSGEIPINLLTAMMNLSMPERS